MSQFDADIRPNDSTHNRIIWGLATAAFLLHLAVAGRYGLFRNELYFIICGRHPAFGYADQPPLVPLLAAATQIFGPNMILLRLPAALAAGALCPLSACFAGLLGGGAVARVIAAAASLLAPGLAALTATLGTSSFEPLAWTGCAFFLSRAVLREDRRALIWAGAIAGVAAQAKYGIALWGVGLAVGLLATRARHILAWKEFWAGLLLAALLAAPSLIWQQLHAWPFFEIITSPITSGKGFIGSPLQFIVRQAIEMNPLLAPLWLTGLISPFLVERLRAVSFLPIAMVIAAAIDVIGGGKNYYIYPAFPALFALGAAALPDLMWPAARWWLAAATAVFVILAPIVLPILAPLALDRYLETLHLRPTPIEAAGIGAPLTQVFSDEMGWQELEQTVATIFRALPDQDRQRAAIIASNYGEAAAIDLFGPADHLPPALTGQNQYFLWGPRGFDGSMIIHVGGDPDRWRQICQSLEMVGSFGVAYAMPYETNQPIFVCRGLRGGLARAWPRFKRYR
jgi:hypothetical protein